MTQAHDFDTATTLQQLGEGHWAGEASPAYLNIVGPFGGVIAATLLRAIIEDGRAHGDPVSMTVNFCAAIKTGAYEIATKCIRTGKHTQHWSLELTQENEIRATATILMGVRRTMFTYEPSTPPDAPAYETIEPLDVSSFSAWLRRYEFRFVEGEMVLAPEPLETPRPARTTVWVKDVPDRPLDYLSLAALSDSFFFRLLHVRGALIPNGTVSLTTYFHGTQDEIVQQGAAPLLGIADAKRFNANFHDQDMQLWGRNGQLLASGSQIVWYKE